MSGTDETFEAFCARFGLEPMSEADMRSTSTDVETHKLWIRVGKVARCGPYIIEWGQGDDGRFSASLPVLNRVVANTSHTRATKRSDPPLTTRQDLDAWLAEGLARVEKDVQDQYRTARNRLESATQEVAAIETAKNVLAAGV